MEEDVVDRYNLQFKYSASRQEAAVSSMADFRWKCLISDLLHQKQSLSLLLERALSFPSYITSDVRQNICIIWVDHTDSSHILNCNLLPLLVLVSASGACLVSLWYFTVSPPALGAHATLQRAV